MEENKTNYTVLEDVSHSDSLLNENEIKLQNVQFLLTVTLYIEEKDKVSNHDLCADLYFVLCPS
jgi:hypothetical protein